MIGPRNIGPRNAARIIGLAALAGVLASCAASGPAHAQAASDIPVLVMGEDGDPASVSRRSNIHKRVLAALKESVQRDGYRMVDEEMIAVDLGWAIVERRPST